MKILFLSNDYLESNANANCIKNLLNILERDNTVEIGKMKGMRFCLYQQAKKVHSENIEDVLEQATTLRRYTKRILEYGASGCFLKLVQVFLRLTQKIFCVNTFLQNEKLRLLLTTKHAYRLLKHRKYDCVISVCSSFDSHYLASKIKKKNKKIQWTAYYLDPYSFNYMNQANKDACLKIEYNVLKQSDKIVFPPLMRDSFTNSRLNCYLDRVQTAEFPNVVDRRQYHNNSKICFEKENINCVFVGYLYKDIRNPEYLFNLLIRCSKKNKKIKLYIVGGYYGDFSEEWKQYYLNCLKENLELVGLVSLEESYAILNDADILINIGNSVDNQLPSKIFDYISTGKPIVNMVKLENCPTLEYLERYPNKLNIFEREELNEGVVEQFMEFCTGNKNMEIPYEKIGELYKTATPEHVIKQIVNI